MPFTQLHGWWHVLAGYSSYIHIIYCLHHRQTFLKQNTKITIQPWIGITIETDVQDHKTSNKLLPCSEEYDTDYAKNK